MCEPTLRSTTILTEHLQYPPISLVDDVINAVNEIMYKCTAAMEKYLLEKSTLSQNGVDYTDEIKIGVGKLETLLEYSVDKNFDKFELYVLRNILRIPNELLDKNAFRLESQRDLIASNKDEIEQTKIQLDQKIKSIEEAFELNYELTRRYKELKKLHNKVKKFKAIVIKILECEDSQTGKELYKTLQPIDDSIKFLTSKIREWYIFSEEHISLEQVRNITSNKATSESAVGNAETLSRSKYIENRVKMILNGNSSTPKEEKPNLSKNFGELKITNPDLPVLTDQLP
ncbi:hypothetical protein TPHA_0N00420 [Tetrapisispora phaffii CBS 4417]|uniref:Mis12 domain-containing protein n=1 Tax=Tetrapisispora phaffii (strain ATCC 24235 / CBS 4417 / NBRC 1672 / NRRL Y-8282 / UCD 70-5) TaxID=1071381 RepID=G8C0Z4_TETPH|nr:hypothetical protein TPHA_0N00420 [Tetrapisispora phaffii CBS 4417]CCE65822.1 hypothetical protein TPHA_0N00420 [Tetrapisispora phaffii CBS 4417]